MEYTNKTTKTSQENCTPCNRRNISYHMMKYTHVTRKTSCDRKYTSCDKRSICHRRIFSCEINNISCDRKFISFDRNKKEHLVSQCTFPVTGNLLLWQEITSCDRKCFPVTGNFFAVRANLFLWQQDLSCVRKFLPVTGIFCLEACKLLYTISLWGSIIILVAGTFCSILFHCTLKNFSKNHKPLW